MRVAQIRAEISVEYVDGLVDAPKRGFDVPSGRRDVGPLSGEVANIEFRTGSRLLEFCEAGQRLRKRMDLEFFKGGEIRKLKVGDLRVVCGNRVINFQPTAV